MTEPEIGTEFEHGKPAEKENSTAARRTHTEANAGPAISAKGKTDPRNRKESAKADSIPPRAVL